MTSETTPTTTVSEETTALVERKLGDEPDEIKQKMAELVEVIKKRAEANLQEAEDMTRESYVQAITEAKDTLKKTEKFFKEQEESLDQSIQNFTDKATDKWEKFVSDLKAFNNRVEQFEQAVEAAWKNLIQEEPKA